MYFSYSLQNLWVRIQKKLKKNEEILFVYVKCFLKSCKKCLNFLNLQVNPIQIGSGDKSSQDIDETPEEEGQNFEFVEESSSFEEPIICKTVHLPGTSKKRQLEETTDTKTEVSKKKKSKTTFKFTVDSE